MAAFDDITADLDDLEDLTSAVFDDVHPDDVIQATDADGDTLTAAYFVRSYADPDDGTVAGFHLQTTPSGCIISIAAAEALAEFLAARVAQAQEAGIA